MTTKIGILLAEYLKVELAHQQQVDALRKEINDLKAEIRRLEQSQNEKAGRRRPELDGQEWRQVP